MIRIKKLLINNFKGIKNKIIVDFQKNNNHNQILSGPNGFGKTTIFEALELCITGKFDRIQTFKDVQIKNRSRNKPFFQNTDGENVVIKLLLEKNEQEIIITKLYDDVNSPKRGNTAKDFIPEDSHNFFFTYLEENSDNFESLTFDENKLVDQLSINQLFLGSEAHVELDSIYYLFNYIQQEESIRFLKQREDIKGSSLAFLFNIEKEENQQMQLEKIVENFRKQKNTIDEEIEILESSQFGLQSIEYQNLFELKEINFDKIEPFEDLKDANTFFPSYIEQIDKLITFINVFDASEYNKSIIFNEINNEILVNDFLLNSLLISNIYTGSLLDQVSSNNQKILRYKKILDLEDNQFITKENIQEFFDDDQKEKYEMLENQITDINTELGEIGVIISNLISANQMVWSHYNSALDNNHLSDHQCPLCNSDFSNFEQLIQAYEKQIENLTKFNQNKIDEKQKLLETLKLFHRTIKNDVEKFLKENLPINNNIIELIGNYPNLQNSINSIKERFFKLDLGFPDDIYLSILPSEISEFNVKKKELKNFLENDLLNKYRYNSQKINNKEFYSMYFDSDEERMKLISDDLLEQKKQYLQLKFQLLSNERLSFLKERGEKLTAVYNHIESLNTTIFSTIKNHKVEMIEKIKIPFFIYSGKILQNYQQGFGIFIDILPTGQRNNVVLKTGKDSDHDIVFHLSAGQMAVVSLAFCLSLNKVYNTNENFKFLAIDDPIQTMDNLNVHSFVELLRHEFADYQIILSTHDDFISRYISYKFEKYNMKASIQNVQDLVLEQTFS